ncbi:MAG: hypothetical protein WC277_07525 [Bacilli bacterium]
MFASPPHARRFWNTSFIGRYAYAESASGRPNRVSGSFTAWVHGTESDRGFFAVAVFAGPPTLADIAHEAVHVARRYVERVGIRKDWGTNDGYEIGDPEEQTAYAAGSAAGLMAEVAGDLKDEMSNEKEAADEIPHEDKPVQAENAAAVGVVVGARAGGLRRPEGGRVPGGSGRAGGRPDKRVGAGVDLRRAAQGGGHGAPRAGGEAPTREAASRMSRRRTKVRWADSLADNGG